MIPLLRVTSSAVAGRVRPRAVVAAVVRRCVDTGAAAALSSTASPPAPPLSADPRYVDSAAAPAGFPLSSAVVYPEAVSEREADAVVQPGEDPAVYGSVVWWGVGKVVGKWTDWIYNLQPW